MKKAERERERGQKEGLRRVAIYARKSTSKGLEQEENTLKFQREACERWIQANPGLEPYPDSYNDGGFTGANTSRPGLQRLLRDAKAGKFQAVAIYKLDRMTRSVRDLCLLIEEFQKYDVEFISVTQNLDTSTPFGRLALNLLACVAQWEREINVERIQDKMSDMRRKGRFTGGSPPLGYDIHPERKCLIVNSKEADLVRKIFQRYLECRSLSDVAGELRKEGKRTKVHTARTGRVSGGGTITLAYLSSLLRNYTYIGKVKYRKDIFEGLHDAIVDDHTFHEVQRILRANKHQERTPRISSPDSLLRGLVFCSGGSPMGYTFTKKGSQKKYYYYVCSALLRGLPCQCKKARISAAKLEAEILGEIRKIGQDEGFVADTMQQAKESFSETVEKLTTKQNELLSQRKRLMQWIRYNKSKNQKLEETRAKQEELEELNAAFSETNSALKATTSTEFSESEFRDFLNQFKPGWEALGFDERRRLIELLIVRIDYYHGNAPQQRLEIEFRNLGIRSLEKA